MTNEQEIKEKYQELLEDVATNDFYKVDLTNRVNCYVCPNKHITKTKDIDAGVTPFMEKCETCGEFAQSTMYRDVAPDKQPTIEWYRPTLEEVLQMGNRPGLLDHILQGGLDSRPIKANGTETDKPKPITWQQLKEFVNSIPAEKLNNTAHIIVEDDSFAKPLLEPFFMDKDIYVNKYESEDSGSLEDLKEMRKEEFDINDYELLTAAGTPFLWTE